MYALISFFSVVCMHWFPIIFILHVISCFFFVTSRWSCPLSHWLIHISIQASRWSLWHKAVLQKDRLQCSHSNKHKATEEPTETILSEWENDPISCWKQPMTINSEGLWPLADSLENTTNVLTNLLTDHEGLHHSLSKPGLNYKPAQTVTGDNAKICSLMSCTSVAVNI